MIQTYYHGIR